MTQDFVMSAYLYLTPMSGITTHAMENESNCYPEVNDS